MFFNGKKIDFMEARDLDGLLVEKGNACVSIIIPTRLHSRDRMQNPVLVKKAIRKARGLLEKGAWPKNLVEQLDIKFLTIPERIDFIHLQEGLAIFVSPNILKIFLLPFRVKGKVTVGTTFEIRDIIYCMQYLKPYYLLTISKKKIRLFTGTGQELQEITNSDFPKQYLEEYEYSPPSPGSPPSPALKAFERDKSIVKETRLRGFLKDADRALEKYLREGAMLIVAGVKKELADFEQTSHHLAKLSGKIPGNYDFDAVRPLAENAWKRIQYLVKKSQRDLLAKADEELGRGRLISGITHVWREACNGNGSVLLLERDYQVAAYLNPGDSSEILITPPSGLYGFVPDATNDLIEIVRGKGGRVTIYENGQLSKYGHIALLLRHPI